MPKKTVFADKAAPVGGPYSHAVIAGDHVYLAGSVPVLPDGTRLGGAPFAEQARAAFTNLATVAQAAGASLSQAVRVGVYLRDWDDFAEMNQIYVEFFGEQNLPVRTTIPVPLKGIDIEIDAILYIGQ